MRNAPPRIPFEKLALSQPVNVKNKQLNLAQKIGKEEDEYLNDMNQFYLDYQNYEQKRLYVLQLKQLQSIINQEKITKSTFNSIFLDQLDQRKKNALQILNEHIIDNSELEKEVIALESKVLKYQKALKQRSSVKYLYGDLYPMQSNNEKKSKNLVNLYDKPINIENIEDLPKNSISNSIFNDFNIREQQKNKYESLESRIIELQIQNEEKQVNLRRKNIILNQQIKLIDNDLYRVQKSLQLYKTERYNSTQSFHQQYGKENFLNNAYDIREIIINKKNIYIREKKNEMMQIKENIDNNEKRYQVEYNELENKFLSLKEEMNNIGKLRKKLFQINEEISINKCYLFNKKNEYYDFNRKLMAQNEEIQRLKDQKSKIQSNINNLRVLMTKKEEDINQKRKYIEELNQRNDVLENELLTMKKITELKIKNLHFIQNQIDAQINGEKSFRKPIKRLLYLEKANIFLKQAFIY